MLEHLGMRLQIFYHLSLLFFFSLFSQSCYIDKLGFLCINWMYDVWVMACEALHIWVGVWDRSSINCKVRYCWTRCPLWLYMESMYTDFTLMPSLHNYIAHELKSSTLNLKMEIVSFPDPTNPSVDRWRPDTVSCVRYPSDLQD